MSGARATTDLSDVPAHTLVDTIRVRGEWRVIGAVSSAELEELERAYDAGDIRAEHTLDLLRGKQR